MSLALRDEFVTRFAAWEVDGAPVLRDVAGHDEDFGLSELSRVGSKATPFARVVRLGFAADEGGSDGDALWSWAVVIAADLGAAKRADGSRGDLAGSIAARVAFELVQGGTFAESTGPAERVRAKNASTTATALKGYAVWVVTFDMRAPIRPADRELVTVPLETIHTDYDYAPDPLDGSEDSATTTEFA